MIIEALTVASEQPVDAIHLVDIDSELVEQARRRVEGLGIVKNLKTVHARAGTRKEAYIKARGAGLSLPLEKFDVSLSPCEPATLLSTRDDEQEASRWLLRELTPDPDYVAAVAVEGSGWQLRCWQWSYPELL